MSDCVARWAYAPCARNRGPTYHDDGRLDGFHGSIQDISERQLYEERRERLIEELTHRNQQLDQFTHTVAHNLKSPLITIRGFASMLRRDLASGEFDKAVEDITRISASAGNMSALLDELLTRSSAGRFINQETEMPLNTLIDDVRQSIGGVLNGLDIEVAPNLPLVFGDRTRLMELFQNLIENAAKFTYNTSSPRLAISATESDQEIECFVTDNGIGIEPTYHEKVFGLFETLGTQGSGTGLGLALARRIVEYHGGQIRVESTGANQGSRFRFTLPKSGARSP